MRFPTVSEMQRAAACHASVALPRLPDDGEQSASMLRGSRIHAVIAARLRKWPMPATGKTKVNHIQLGKLRRYLGHGDMRCEIAMSYDGERVEILGENIGREYNRPGTLCGSADIVMVRPKAMVVDVKTGSFPVPAPKDNWQIATLAALVALAYMGIESVTGVVAQMARDGSWTFDAHTWTAAELASIRRRLDSLRAGWSAAHELEASGFGAVPTPGQHCRFCKCVCPNNEKQVEAA